MKYLFGLLILSITAVLVWFFAFSQFSPFRTTGVINPIPENQEMAIQITEPENGDTVTVQNLKIAGSTKPKTFLALFSQNDSQILTVPENGNFSGSLNLTEGYNRIKVVGFTLSGESQEKNLEVFYLSGKFQSEIDFSENDSTDEIAQQIAELRKKQKLKMIAGTVKGMLSSNLSVEGISDVKTVVINDSTKIRSFENFETGIDVAQLQAADFVVGVGNFAQQGILTAKILQVKPDSPPRFDKIAEFGIISDKIDKSLEITNTLDGKTQNVSTENAQITNENGESISLEQIEVGNKLVVVGGKTNEQISAEIIMIISGNFLSELEKFAIPQPATQSATESAR